MSSTKSPHAFPEVRAVMDAALEHGGAIFTPRNEMGGVSECPPNGHTRAVHTFVCRANVLRNNLRSIGEAAPYERLLILKRGTRVVLEVKPEMRPGDLITLDGEFIAPVEPATTLSEEDRELLRQLEEDMKNG